MTRRRRFLFSVALLSLICVIFYCYALARSRCGVDLRYVECAGHQKQIIVAIQKFHEANGRYPERLEQLSPQCLDKRVLHCPADEDTQRQVSYGYIRPLESDTDSVAVVFCGRHRVRTKPVIIFTQKSAKLRILPY